MHTRDILWCSIHILLQYKEFLNCKKMKFTTVLCLTLAIFGASIASRLSAPGTNNPNEPKNLPQNAESIPLNDDLKNDQTNTKKVSSRSLKKAGHSFTSADLGFVLEPRSKSAKSSSHHIEEPIDNKKLKKSSSLNKEGKKNSNLLEIIFLVVPSGQKNQQEGKRGIKHPNQKQAEVMLDGLDSNPTESPKFKGQSKIKAHKGQKKSEKADEVVEESRDSLLQAPTSSNKSEKNQL